MLIEQQCAAVAQPRRWLDTLDTQVPLKWHNSVHGSGLILCMDLGFLSDSDSKSALGSWGIKN